MPIGTSRLVWLIYALALGIALAAFAMMPWWTVDDAFISYRYGKNLLNAGELTWNVGEAPVEGYTGILLPLLAAALLALGLPLLTTIKLLGIAAMLGTIFIMVRTLSRLGVDKLGQSLAVLGLSATPLLYLHSISGLETVFFSFFITGALGGMALPEKSALTQRQAATVACFVLLAGLCRPEGIALAGIAALYYFFKLARHKFKGSHLKQFIIFFSPLVLLAIYWVWRTGYYGSFFPNSYHAKSFEGFINMDSLLAMGKFAVYYCALPALAAFLLHFGNGKSMRDLGLGLPWAAFAFLLACCATYLHSNLWMNYGSRFFFPFLPVLVIGLAKGIASGWQVRQVRPGKLGKGLRLSLGILMVLQVGILGFRFKQEWAFLRYYHAIVQDELIPAGKHLATALPPNSTVISYMDAGALGYYSNQRIIDFGRLNDSYLAQQKPDRDAVLKYFFDQEASAVVMTSEVKDTFQYIEEAEAIVTDPRFRDYALDRQWGNRVDYPYWQRLYLRVQ